MYNELIPDGVPIKLYMDFEYFPQDNSDFDADDLVEQQLARFIVHLCWLIRSCTSSDIVCTKTRFHKQIERSYLHSFQS